MTAELLTFDRFVPGRVMVGSPEGIDDAVLAHWRRLYPWDQWAPDELPVGMATVLMMRAYMRTLSPRPPGNVHQRQRLRLLGPLRADEALVTEFECTGKLIKRERRYLELAVRGRTERARPVFEGVMSMIWAA